MSEATSATHSPATDSAAPPTGINRTAVAIASFFAVLIAFNVVFYVVAITHPVALLPPPASSAPSAPPSAASP
ncbi:MAG: hypothetical protein R3F39_17375 [Myxococcota bacterium]